MELAAEQERQPICTYCKKPLDQVEQVQEEVITWKWDKQTGQYDKHDSSTDWGAGSVTKTIHVGCSKNANDDDFVDNDLIDY